MRFQLLKRPLSLHIRTNQRNISGIALHLIAPFPTSSPHIFYLASKHLTTARARSVQRLTPPYSSEYLSRNPHRNSHTHSIQTSHALCRRRIRNNQCPRPRICGATGQLQPIASLRAETRTDRHCRRQCRRGALYCNAHPGPRHRHAVDTATQRRRTACVFGLAA